MIGPVITDEQFFLQEIDHANPALQEVRRAAENADYALARQLFADYVRQSLKPELFLSIPYEIAENNYTKPGETEQEAAERICRNHMISCGVEHKFGDTIDWCLNPTYNQYAEWTWQLNRHNEWKLLAHVYNQNKDERYAMCVAKQFTSWVEQALRPDPCPGNETLCWRTIECGIRMGANWPYVLHTFCHSPAFTDDVIVNWYKSICEHAYRMQNHHWSHNWLIMEMNGLAQIAILYPEFKSAQEWLAFALKNLEEQLKLQFYADGFQYELSTGYHDVVINNYQRLIQVANTYDVELPQSFLPILERAAEVNIKLMMPNGRVPDINDGTKRTAADIVSPKLRLFPQNKNMLWAVYGEEKGSEPEYKSIAMPDSGFMVMRSGWDKNAIWAMLDAAPFGCAHQHEDKLSFLLYAGGKPLLEEGGNYAYDDSEMRRYVLSTRAHNTIRVDGYDQNRMLSYKWSNGDILKPSGMKYNITPDYDFAEGVYDEGYGPKADKLCTHRRSVIFIKQAPSGLKPFFIIADRMSAAEKHSYQILWHLGEDSAQCRPGAVITGNLTLLYSAAAQGFSLVRGQEFPEWQGWMATNSIQGAYKPVYTAQIRAQEAECRVITILYPHEEPCPISMVEASINPADTNIKLNLADGVSLQLNEADYR